jgi:thiol-disulfide isomerase/thioredoxin
MRSALRNSVLAFTLTAAITIISGCGSSASSQKGPIDEPSAPGPDLASNPEAGTKKASVYPKIASAVATAEIRGLDGSVYTLNDRQGKVLLLNLWATWCGPCRSEIPALVRMQEKHGAQGFEVIGLNTDEEAPELINGFGTELNINYPIAYADTKLQSAMLKISKFPGIPQSFLLDREGRLRGVFRGANPKDIATMEQVVAKVVNESLAEVNGPPAGE